MAAQNVTTAAQDSGVDLRAFERAKADKFDDERVRYCADSFAKLDEDQEEAILEQIGIYSIFLDVPAIVRTIKMLT
jgi:hypothetical protein